MPAFPTEVEVAEHILETYLGEYELTPDLLALPAQSRHLVPMPDPISVIGQLAGASLGSGTGG